MVKKKKEGKGGSHSKFPSYSEWCHGEEPLACRRQQEVHPAVLWGEKFQEKEKGAVDKGWGPEEPKPLTYFQILLEPDLALLQQKINTR